MPEKIDFLETEKSVYEFYDNLFKASKIKSHNFITRLFKKPKVLPIICKMCGNGIEDEKLRQNHNFRCRKAHLLLLTKYAILARISSNRISNHADEDSINRNTAKLEAEIHGEKLYWWKMFKLNMNECIQLNISNFKVIRPLTKGSFGQIFLIKDKKVERNMVLKIISVSEAIQRSCIGFYVNERDILLKTTSKYIIDLYYSFRSEFFIYQIMEYIDGGDLSAHLEVEECFPEEQVKAILMQCTIALKDLHSRNIIHGDIKLENILYSRENSQIKLADFGLAFYENNSTNTGLGTPEYMAPEQILNSIKGTQSDIWALGICAYEMLTGMPPYYGESPESILEKTASGQKIMWELKHQNISSDLKDLVERLLDFNYKSRATIKEIMNHGAFSGLNWLDPPSVSLSDSDKVFDRRNRRYNGINFYHSSTIESEIISIDDGVDNQNTTVQNQLDLLKLFPIKNLNKMI